MIGLIGLIGQRIGLVKVSAPHDFFSRLSLLNNQQPTINYRPINQQPNQIKSNQIKSNHVSYYLFRTSTHLISHSITTISTISINSHHSHSLPFHFPLSLQPFSSHPVHFSLPILFPYSGSAVRSLTIILFLPLILLPVRSNSTIFHSTPLIESSQSINQTINQTIKFKSNPNQIQQSPSKPSQIKQFQTTTYMKKQKNKKRKKNPKCFQFFF